MDERIIDRMSERKRRIEYALETTKDDKLFVERTNEGKSAQLIREVGHKFLQKSQLHAFIEQFITDSTHEWNLKTAAAKFAELKERKLADELTRIGQELQHHGGEHSHEGMKRLLELTAVIREFRPVQDVQGRTFSCPAHITNEQEMAQLIEWVQAVDNLVEGVFAHQELQRLQREGTKIRERLRHLVGMPKEYETLKNQLHGLRQACEYILKVPPDAGNQQLTLMWNYVLNVTSNPKRLAESVRKVNGTYVDEIKKRVAGHIEQAEVMHNDIHGWYKLIMGIIEQELSYPRMQEYLQKEMMETIAHAIEIETKNTVRLRDEITHLSTGRLEEIEKQRKKTLEGNEKRLRDLNQVAGKAVEKGEAASHGFFDLITSLNTVEQAQAARQQMLESEKAIAGEIYHLFEKFLEVTPEEQEKMIERIDQLMGQVSEIRTKVIEIDERGLELAQVVKERGIKVEQTANAAEPAMDAIEDLERKAA
ncbi:hypothetical protein J4460_01100 [Candidatus Woesearchaeota archaeon]|nr:hypothetical protein [Candidatus Woesearchaeota archaeon]HIH38551.1 hypothetical protein [Candidatus Woesearchaeota archaeon]HIH48506.1 hypothetical protein [Candidatus Woesearchaeota archaeon]HIJ02755.1 hypothetical protein [Candidatus Woesearchaeota archaeon]